ncbi:hypothetical protein [Flammeovirga pacifica]
MTVLRRLDAILEDSKEEVLEEQYADFGSELYGILTGVQS